MGVLEAKKPRNKVKYDKEMPILKELSVYGTSKSFWLRPYSLKWSFLSRSQPWGRPQTPMGALGAKGVMAIGAKRAKLRFKGQVAVSVHCIHQF